MKDLIKKQDKTNTTANISIEEVGRRVKMYKRKYNQLREEIILAVPEIVINENAQLIQFNGKVKYFRQYRPITLEDCLIAIDKKELKNEYGDKTFVMINTNGMFETDLYNWEEEPVFWTIGKPLHQQEQETIDFLWDLICNK